MQRRASLRCKRQRLRARLQRHAHVLEYTVRDKFLRFIHCLMQPNANDTKRLRLVVAASTATATLITTIFPRIYTRTPARALCLSQTLTATRCNSGATVGRLCHTSTPASHLAGTFSLHLVFHDIAYNDAWGEFHAMERSCPSS
jgi:hypothetical protein